WLANGGLAQFGYPISEEQTDYFIGGPSDRYQVQYFERARFELHPENAPPYDVLLGQFGRQIMTENSLLSDRFAPLFIANSAVIQALGSPLRAAEQVQGATQAFERGRMVFLQNAPTYFQGDGPAIYALCGQRSGRWFPSPDTWQEGQDPGGGPAPTPG